MLAPQVNVQPASRSGSRLGQYNESAAGESTSGGPLEGTASEPAGGNINNNNNNNSNSNMASAVDELAPRSESVVNHKSDTEEDIDDDEVSVRYEMYCFCKHLFVSAPVNESTDVRKNRYDRITCG